MFINEPQQPTPEQLAEHLLDYYCQSPGYPLNIRVENLLNALFSALYTIDKVAPGIVSLPAQIDYEKQQGALDLTSIIQAKITQATEAKDREIEAKRQKLIKERMENNNEQNRLRGIVVKQEATITNTTQSAQERDARLIEQGRQIGYDEATRAVGLTLNVDHEDLALVIKQIKFHRDSAQLKGGK